MEVLGRRVHLRRHGDSVAHSGLLWVWRNSCHCRFLSHPIHLFMLCSRKPKSTVCTRLYFDMSTSISRRWKRTRKSLQSHKHRRRHRLTVSCLPLQRSLPVHLVVGAVRYKGELIVLVFIRFSIKLIGQIAPSWHAGTSATRHLCR